MLLLLLSVLVLAAAASVVVRLGWEGRGERALAMTLGWNALVLAPIHVLGLTNALTRAGLALGAIACSGAVIGATFIGRDRRAHARDVVSELVMFARAPWDALVICVRARSFAALGVVFAALVVLWTAWLSYLLPSESWDGTWYHELMVGYAIQNHGYAMADLPRDLAFPANMIQQANGYPRNCEMTWLWFTLLFDGRLIEITNSLMIAPLALGTYVMARRFGGDRSLAIGWGCAMVLVPSAALQMRSTYMDVHVASFYVGALALATRATLRVRDAWATMIALALLVGAKSHGLIHVPTIAAVLSLRFALQQRARPLAVITTIALGGALICAVASITYARNWIAFHDPLWPMSFDSDRFGVHWRGLANLDQFAGNKPPAEMWTGATAWRKPGEDFPDTGDWAWGWTTPFFLFPLSLIAIVDALASLARGKERARALGLVAIVFPLGVTIATAHNLWHPRYNLHLLAGMMVLTHALFATRAPRVIEGLVGATLCGNLLFLFWAKPAWNADWDEARAIAHKSVDERQASYVLGWSPSREVGLARERELDGALVVFSDELMFPAYLWNRVYTNRVEWLERMPAHAWALRAEELGARWAVVGEGSDLASELTQRGWERVGVAARGGPACVALRRPR